MYEEWEDEQYEIHHGELYNKFVAVDHYPGIAFYVTAYVDDEMVECYMVGDDQKHLVSTYRMKVLDAKEFCLDCGQIGCVWHVGE